jgi:hypothetical protein
VRGDLVVVGVGMLATELGLDHAGSHLGELERDRHAGLRPVVHVTILFVWPTTPVEAAYSPTTDQPALAEVVDLELTRRRPPSFDKLWRDVEVLRSAAP